MIRAAHSTPIAIRVPEKPVALALDATASDDAARVASSVGFFRDPCALADLRRLRANDLLPQAGITKGNRAILDQDHKPCAVAAKEVSRPAFLSLELLVATRPRIQCRQCRLVAPERQVQVLMSRAGGRGVRQLALKNMTFCLRQS